MKFIFLIIIVWIISIAATVYFSLRIGKKKQEQIMHNDVRNLTIKLNKFTNYFRIFDSWMMLKEDKISLQKYFYERNYKNIVIYGLGVMGGHLYEELKDSEINIVYAIDKKTEIHYSNLLIRRVPDNNVPVDVIVVTATFQYKEIKAELEKVIKCPIISLEEVVKECQ